MPRLGNNALVTPRRDERDLDHHTLRVYAEGLRNFADCAAQHRLDDPISRRHAWLSPLTTQRRGGHTGHDSVISVHAQILLCGARKLEGLLALALDRFHPTPIGNEERHRDRRATNGLYAHSFIDAVNVF